MARINKGRARQAQDGLQIDQAETRPRDDIALPVLALLVITAVGGLLRGRYLSQPMRYDEAVTYLNFARLPWLEAVSEYPYPNNHVFHTVLVKLAVGAFGDEPWVLRLPAFAAGVLTIPASYLAAQALYGKRAGLLTAALVAGCGALTLYSTNARGYSLVVLATLLLIVLAAHARSSMNRLLWLGYALVGAIGLWTVPVMLYPLGGVTLWCVVSRWADDWGPGTLSARQRVYWPVASAALACVLAAVLYVPVVLHSGLNALIGNTFVAPSSMGTFFAELPAGFAEAGRLFMLGVAWPAEAALLVCLVAGAVYHGRSRLPVSLLVSVVAWSAILLLVDHHVPFARVWLFLLPLVFMVAAVGAVRALGKVLDRFARAPVAISLAAVLLAAGAAVGTARSDAVTKSPETGTFVDAEAVARDLAPQLRPGDRIVGAIPKALATECSGCGYSAMELSYWLDKLGVDSTFMTAPESDARRILLVVNFDETGAESVEQLKRTIEQTSGPSAPKLVAEFPQAMVLSVLRGPSPDP